MRTWLSAAFCYGLATAFLLYGHPFKAVLITILVTTFIVQRKI